MTEQAPFFQRGSKLPSFQIAFRRTAVVAAVFSAIVLAALIWNALAARASDPTPPTRIDALVARLNVEKQNKALMADLRRQDAWLRTEYVRRQRFARTGSWLLLLGIGTFFGCLRVSEKLSRRPPMPSPNASERYSLDSLTQQRGVLAMGLLLGGGLALVATLSRHDSVASYVADSRMPGNVPAAKQEPGTSLAVLPPPSANAPTEGAKPAPITGQIPNPSGPTALNASTTSLVPLPAPKPPSPPAKTAATATCQPLAATENWSMFRGSNGLATASGEYPTKLDHVLWRTPLTLPGHNSPAVWGDRLFLTGATATKREVQAFDLKTGKPIWKTGIPMLKGSGPMKQATDAGFAPATVAIDSQRVIAVFVNGDAVCLSHDGKPIWGRAFGTLDNNYGHASSPVLAEGKLILQVDQGSAPEDGKSMLYALDPATGNTIWKVERPVCASWSTPLVLTRAGKPVVVASAAPDVIAYDLADGKELWRTEGLSGEVAPSPAYGDGLVFAAQLGAGLLAIDAGTGKVLWNSADASLPDIVSPTFANGLVFLAGPDGTFTAVEAKTGKIAWEKKLLKVAKSSPVVVGDHVYIVDGAGVAYVLKAAPTDEEIAKTDLGEPVQSTPAFVGGRIYIRGEKTLFCVGAQ